MMRRWTSLSAGALLCAVPLIGMTGCKKEEPTKAETETSQRLGAEPAPVIGPAQSAIEPTLDEGWCGGHGVPESVCTRCNDTLIPKFKKAGDWCGAHGLPESQCTICNPEAEAEWKKLNPAVESSRKPSEKPALAVGPAQSAIKPTLDEGWCGGHGVPESVCTRCNDALIPIFKEAGDWCGGHGLPESQCTICNPEAAAEWQKLNPAARPSEPKPDETSDAQPLGFRLERSPRLVTGASDPLCQVDTLRVRFIDPSIVRKAGIEVERVQRRAMSATIEVPAEVEFNATRRTRVTPRVAGVVREVVVHIGDSVNAQDLLAIVDSPVLGEAKSRFIERLQRARLAEADLQRTETIARGIGKMLEVCTPEASAREVREALAGSPVGDAKAKLLRAQATLQLARTEAAREATLLEKRLTSQAEYQSTQGILAAAEAEFVALREEIAFSTERQRLDATRADNVAKSSLGAAERRLHILGLSEAQIDAIGNETDERLSRFELRSPIAGRLIDLTAAVGESVETSDVLFVVADTSDMWLAADVYERDLMQLSEGLPVHFTVDAMRGVSFEGRVTWISSQVNDRTRTVRLRAVLPNPDGFLRAGMFGRARIVLHDNEEVVCAPIGAVQTDGCCQLVFVRESDTVFQPRKVVLGASVNGFVEVLKGLEEGEVVASTGSFLMKTEILKGKLGAGCCEVDPGR